MRKPHLTIAPVLLAILGGAALAFAVPETPLHPTTRPAAPAAAAVGQPAPDFALTDHLNRPVRLADFKGRVVVLEWLNPGCPFVLRHYQERTFATLAAAYAGRGVAYLAINSSAGDAPADNKAFADEQKVAYPILSDADGAVGQRYGAKATPTLVVIDKAGRLAYRGAVDDDPEGAKPPEKRTNHVARALDDLLAGRPVGTPETKSYGCGIKYGK